MTKVIETPQQMMAWRKSVNASVGFVPTMGALHAGHEELIKKARQENDLVVLSLFINPTQFNDPKDFEKYPITWDEDLKMAKENSVDIIFAPKKDSMYPDDYRFKVIETDFSKLLCGNDRPGHFDGVLSVVMKLFNVVRPQRAYFGEKDFQQLELIRGMTEAFFMDLVIVPVATVRESSGLARSSRNTRLNQDDRFIKAPLIYKYLIESETAEEARHKLAESGFEVDYVTDIKGRRFVAAKVGGVRLIDNVKI